MAKRRLRITPRSTAYRVMPGGTFSTRKQPDEVHVNADEFERASEAARLRFEQWLPKCVTTFYLPPMNHAEEHTLVNLNSHSDINGQQALLALRNIPFPCLRVCQTVLVEDGPPMDTQVICFGDGSKFGWMARDHSATGVTTYSPTGVVPAVDESLPMSYINLMEVLSNNSARYVESPVSRQVRRRNGYADGYREYIVIRKPSKEERKSAMRLTEVFRRHPRLHAVRGHLRHYRTGLVVPIAAHARGGKKGAFELLQAKNYVTEEAYYGGEA